MYALSAAIHQNRSRAWTYCCYFASSLGTHVLAIRMSQKNSRSAGLSGYAWIQPARQLKLVVPSQPFIDTVFRSVWTEIFHMHGSLRPNVSQCIQYIGVSHGLIHEMVVTSKPILRSPLPLCILLCRVTHGTKLWSGQTHEPQYIPYQFQMDQSWSKDL